MRWTLTVNTQLVSNAVENIKLGPRDHRRIINFCIGLAVPRNNDSHPRRNKLVPKCFGQLRILVLGAQIEANERHHLVIDVHLYLLILQVLFINPHGHQFSADELLHRPPVSLWLDEAILSRHCIFDYFEDNGDAGLPVGGQL